MSTGFKILVICIITLLVAGLLVDIITDTRYDKNKDEGNEKH